MKSSEPSECNAAGPNAVYHYAEPSPCESAVQLRKLDSEEWRVLLNDDRRSFNVGPAWDNKVVAEWFARALRETLKSLAAKENPCKMKTQDQPESKKPLPYESVIRYRGVRAPFVPHLNAWQVYLSVDNRSLDVGPAWNTEDEAQKFGKLVAGFLQEIEPKEHAALRDWISQVEAANGNLASERDATRIARDAMALARDVAHHNLNVARGRAERLENDNALLATEREELRKLKFDLEKDVRRLTKERNELNASLYVARHNLDAIRIDSGRQLAEVTSRLEHANRLLRDYEKTQDRLEERNAELTKELEAVRSELKAVQSEKFMPQLKNELELRTEECEWLRARLKKVAELLARASRL